MGAGDELLGKECAVSPFTKSQFHASLIQVGEWFLLLAAAVQLFKDVMSTHVYGSLQVSTAITTSMSRLIIDTTRISNENLRQHSSPESRPLFLPHFIEHPIRFVLRAMGFTLALIAPVFPRRGW